jgi:ubiquitin C-terminal hydrolase
MSYKYLFKEYKYILQNNQKMSFSKYENNGLTGLANLGNTCFLNTTMQILSHCYELNDFLDTKYSKKLKNKYESVLLVEWDNLRKLMWKDNNRVIQPGKFIQTVQHLARIKKVDIFTGFAQNDSSEFLLFIINAFHDALSREVNMTISGNVVNDTDKMAVQCYEMVKKMYSKDYSEIWNLFYGINISMIKRAGEEKVLSMNAEPFFMIDLSIPEHIKEPTLMDCFHHYSQGEVLEGDNAWYNEETKTRENVKKQIRFWSLPTLLVIDLKRFNKYNFRNKNQSRVDFPLENLDLSAFVEGYKKDSYVYDLFGVSNHYGTPMGGHYTAFVKNANGKWYHFNDTQVSPIEDASKIITPNAYCFFYRKKT